MESMLALLPPGEDDGLLFQMLFLARLPNEISDHMAAYGELLSSTETASLANNLWFARNQRQVPGGSGGGLTGVPGDGGVATLSVQPRCRQPPQRRAARRQAGQQALLQARKVGGPDLVTAHN